ncbi:MAG: tRNA pseudouridine(38-40) synthase TruA [Firmicutes bacterium]|nr:tRNA pseudouridine(38-40) synthase TruA [Bacillota bacterium]
MERNFLLTIEYDGSGFSGWQRQPDVRTAQGELEAALSHVMGQPVQVNGTSRTDAGVHALGQQASFHGEFGIPTGRIQTAVNNLLAGKGGGFGKLGRVGDMRITKVEEKPTEFHARFDSRGKRYRYIIGNGPDVDIFRRKYSYQIIQPLDEEAMQDAAQYIVGTHDFVCFQAAGGNERETTVRTIYSLTVKRQGDDVVLEVTGDGFLYNMVRIITGTLVEVGLGKRKPEELAEVIESGDRRMAGHTAPAEGLYLVEVFYEEEQVQAARDEGRACADRR